MILINALPFALHVVFYSSGAMAELFLFLPVFSCLVALNCLNCKKTGVFLLYQGFLLVCIFCAGSASTYLYYHNISDDGMTMVVGKLMVLVESTIHIATTIIAAVIKAIINKKRPQAPAC